MMTAACALRNISPARAIAIIAGLHVFFTLITAVLAIATGAPFVLWFHDTIILLAMMLALLLALGIVWDGSLVGVGLVMDVIWRFAGNGGTAPLGVVAMRSRSLFYLWPCPYGVAACNCGHSFGYVEYYIAELGIALSKLNRPGFRGGGCV